MTKVYAFDRTESSETGKVKDEGGECRMDRRQKSNYLDPYQSKYHVDKAKVDDPSEVHRISVGGPSVLDDEKYIFLHPILAVLKYYYNPR